MSQGEKSNKEKALEILNSYVDAKKTERTVYLLSYENCIEKPHEDVLERYDRDIANTNSLIAWLKVALTD
jgi:hypothetical protein